MPKKWSSTPKHIMRKKCIEYAIKKWEPASFIEFGAGTGDVTTLFLEKGYYGKCYDLGVENRQILRNNLVKYSHQVEVVEDLESIKGLQFDYLFAFEVLEHIKNDAEALKEWSTSLKSGGKILISVPAHMSKYNKDDEFVGHVRRYEKAEITQLLERTGYKDITVLNHGFPLGNITRMMSNIIQGSKKTHQNGSLEERSIKSGVERNPITNKLAFLFNEITLMPFIFLQKFFLQKDWGDGYVVYAEKI
ncbi:MAG: class I SAM-dependent methyltransferase [Thiomargarita sp.]|nr:class I SAM-dependent methyltransferase [Thiomargarita sp.]